MKWLNGDRVRLVFVGIMVALVFSDGSTRADFTFGEPMNLGPGVNSSTRDEEPGISADGLSIYFCSQRAGGYGGYDMWVTTRATTQADWGPPVNLGLPVNSSSDDFSEDISADGLELYFGSNRSGSYSYDIWVARRATTQDAWTTPVNLGLMVNSSSDEGCPAISDDGLELYFWSTRSGGSGSYDIWISRRATTQDAWGMAENLGPTINSPAGDLCTDISPDGLSLILVSARAGGYGGSLGDLWLTRRSALSSPWGQPVNLGPAVNGSSSENGPCLSTDGSMLYFSSDRPGGSGAQDMWQVSINPVVDLNGDQIVDSADVCIIVDHWGEDYPPCDIGPIPWGDGIVDIEDLKVLAEYLFEEVNDPTLLAHWPLDEAQGATAYDSAAGFDGTLVGGPIWQPEGGMLLGSLQLDGIDDYVSTDPVLDPSKGAFSVVAWINGGAPGQTVFSQIARADWLLTDSVEGCLMTNLTGSGRGSSGPLRSETIINDGNWHRIGLVWDGSYRHLYVDGAEAARDAVSLSSLESAYGGFYFGTDKTRTAGTFFSGLIDDIRIYNRVVSP